MPAERHTILLVEDDPTSLRLTAKLLRGEGHVVHIASTAEQALTALSTLRPELMLVDLQLPGMSGLELTRQVSHDNSLHNTVVVALTACTGPDTRQKAQEAGCIGYLTKPIDARTLALRVHEYLNGSRDHSAAEPDAALAPESGSLLPESEMESLRRSFLAEGAVQSEQALASLGSTFDAIAFGRLVHQWVGSAGLLGFARISELAREVEALLRTPACTVGQLRVSLSNLTRAFVVQAPAEDVALPEFILRQLAGKSFALVGFSEMEAGRLCRALEHVDAKPRLFSIGAPAEYPTTSGCSLVIVHVRSENFGSRWLSPDFAEHSLLPLVLVGERKDLLCLNPSVQLHARELLIDDWQPEEALMRMAFALSRAFGPAPVLSPVSAASADGNFSAPARRPLV